MSGSDDQSSRLFAAVVIGASDCNAFKRRRRNIESWMLVLLSEGIRSPEQLVRRNLQSVSAIAPAEALFLTLLSAAGVCRT
jgi:hypothetical protein